MKPESSSNKSGLTIGFSFSQTKNYSNKDGDLFSHENRKVIKLTNNASMGDKLNSQKEFLTYEEYFEAAVVMREQQHKEEKKDKRKKRRSL